jgi:hypothetical protein
MVVTILKVMKRGLKMNQLNPIISFGILVCIIIMAMLCKYIYIKIIKKDEIIYRIKDNRKSKYVFLFLGYIFLLVSFFLSIMSKNNTLEIISIILILLEITFFWTIIELSDTIISKKIVYKIWEIKVKNIESYEFKVLSNKKFLILNKNNRRHSIIQINSYDEKHIIEFFIKNKILQNNAHD